MLVSCNNSQISIAADYIGEGKLSLYGYDVVRS